MIIFLVGRSVRFDADDFVRIERCGIDLGTRFDNARSDRSRCLGDIQQRLN